MAVQPCTAAINSLKRTILSTRLVGERGQTELTTNLLQTAHQERALVHPLLDAAERMFHRLTALVEKLRSLRQPGLHPVQYRLVLQAGHRPELALCAA